MKTVIKPCAECHRLTRPCHAKIADFPGTVVRRGPVCNGCRMYAQPALTPQQERALAYHLAGLTSFLARRHAREHAQARADHLQTILERTSA